MSQPKLSICIPTYNRAQYLSELLDSIIKQAPIDGSVEICISDNASVDNTREIIESYKVSFPYIVYHVNAENLGADLNFLKVVDISSGEYCWLMGSDDKLVDNAVNFILNLIEQHNYSIMIFEHFQAHDIDLKKTYQSAYLNIKKDETFNLSDIEEFKKYSELAFRSAAFFAYLSSIVFKRCEWISVESNEKYIGTAYIHAQILLLMILNNNPCDLFYCKKAIVFTRAHNDSFQNTKDSLQRIILDVRGFRKLSEVFEKKPAYKKYFLMSIQKEAALYDSYVKTLFFCLGSNRDSYDTLIKEIILYRDDLKKINSPNSFIAYEKLYRNLIKLKWAFYIPSTFKKTLKFIMSMMIKLKRKLK